MSYHIDGTDIVIDGWEKGISDNPLNGINDMRGINIVSIPGQAALSFAPTNQVICNWTANVVSADAGTDIITISTTSTNLLTDITAKAVIFTGASLPAGITAGTIYWAQVLGATTMKIYSDLQYNTLINITGTGTGTVATVNVGEVTYFDKTSSCYIDSNGRAWRGNLYLGNAITGTTGLTNAHGNGIVYYKGYLFIFQNSRICYTNWTADPTSTPNTNTWIYEWDPQTGAAHAGTDVFYTAVGTNNIHEALYAQDNAIYITDASYVVSILEKAGATFDPTSTATYTWNGKTNASSYALALPSYETALCLEELGTNLLVGGSFNYIYPWDRVSTSFSYPIKISENVVTHMLTVNTNTYIFAGQRGRIFVTNGSQANLYAKIPDHITGIDPIFTWKNCAFNKNQIYFGFTVKNNAQTDITTYAGLWAIDITTNALRCVNLMSNPTANVTAIYASVGGVSGYGLQVAWKDGSNYGVDTTAQYPYSTYVAYIETDLIPVGQFLNKRSFTNLEWKTMIPLANGEGIKISYRTSKTGSYTQIGETLATANYLPMSDFYTLNFDRVQWLQFKIEMKSLASSSATFCRLVELRLR